LDLAKKSQWKDLKIAVLLGSLCLIPLISLATMDIGPADPQEVQTRTFELTYYTSITDIPPDTQHLEIWIPYPKSDRHQEILDISIDSSEPGAVFTEPIYENQILYTSVPAPKSSSYDIELKFTVERREYLSPGLDNSEGSASENLDSSIERFLQPPRLVPLTDEVKQWATEVTQGKTTDLAKARAIYDYAISTLKYDKSGEGWGRGDLLYACDIKRGNCTDFHALFTGFSRAVGIPARFSIGLPLPSERGSGEIGGYHCWAEFYLKGYGWVPVDASEGWKQPEKRDYFFSALDENRVQLSVGRDIALQPAPQSDPLNYFIYPHVELDGQEIEGTVSYTFHFKDLPESEVAAM